MSLFDSLGSKPQQPQPMNPMQKLQELKQNPANVMKQAGFNVPEDMHDPNQIIQYLLQSGQVTQNRLTQARQMMLRR